MIPQKAILLKSGSELISRPDCAGMYVEIINISSKGEVMIIIPFPEEPMRTYTPTVFMTDVHIIDKCQ
jgi:hypothetical protein